MLNGANSRMLHHITGKSIHDEASATTRTFDLVRWIRARRLQWVGHILRMEPDHMVYNALKHLHGSRSQGDILMDVPDYAWPELVQLAANRDGWRQLVKSVREPRTQVIINPRASNPSMNAISARDARAARR